MHARASWYGTFAWQAIRAAAVQQAITSRAEAEAALPPKLVHPYLAILGRVRIFHDRAPETRLKADLERAKRDKDTSTAQVLVQQIASLGFDEQMRVPTAAELATELQNFVSANYDRTFNEIFSASRFAEADKCKALFEGLKREQSGLFPRAGTGGGGGGGGSAGVAPKLGGGSTRDMFDDRDPPPGFTMDEWMRLRDLFFLLGYPYKSSGHVLANVSTLRM